MPSDGVVPSGAVIPLAVVLSSGVVPSGGVVPKGVVLSSGVAPSGNVVSSVDVVPSGVSFLCITCSDSRDEHTLILFTKKDDICFQ